MKTKRELMQSVCAEIDELAAKINRLYTLLYDNRRLDELTACSGRQRSLLVEQYNIMNDYIHILKERKDELMADVFEETTKDERCKVTKNV